MNPSHEAGPSSHTDIDYAAMDMELLDEDLVAGEELGEILPSDVLGEVLELRTGAPYTVVPIFFLLGMELMIGRRLVA